MCKRGFCLACLLFVCVLMLGGVASAADRPNILFCLADDWGWPHAGAYGDPVVATPAFDRLAKEGLLFDNKNSCTTSWVDLTGNAHETMEQLSWKDLTVKGDDATMITELRIQFSQEDFPQPAQDVSVDEREITLNPR